MTDLVVDGRSIVPIRGIPLHTGNYVDVRVVAGLLCDPESYGEAAGAGLVGHYLDAAGVPRRMLPWEFQDMANKIEAGVQSGQPHADLIALLLPGVFVFRENLQACLHGFWMHYTGVHGANLDRGEFEFNPTPRMTAEDEFKIYAGFEDLRTDAKVAPGMFLTGADRLQEAHRLLDKLVRLAAEANIPFDLENPPGRMVDMIGWLRSQTRAFAPIQDDALAGYVNEYGCHFKGGRPSKKIPPNLALYQLS